MLHRANMKKPYSAVNPVRKPNRSSLMTLRSLKTAAVVALAVAGLHLPVTAATAAEDAPKAAAPKSQFSDKRLNDFAAAAKEVFAIRQKYATQFEAASEEADKKRIVQTAQGEMKKAIEGRGLTIEQYNEVLVAAKDDQVLAEKLGKMMEGGPAHKGG